MGILASLEHEKRSTVYDPLNPKDPALVRLFGGRKSLTGVDIDRDSALSSTALFAGVRFLSENMASVPLKLYKREGRGKTPQRDDSRWWLLQASPNPEQTAMELREMTMGFVVTVGNGYIEIVEGRDGIARELWPIVPWRVKPTRSDAGKLVYVVKLPGGGERRIAPERILHFRGFSSNGLLGDDVIERMRESIGLTIAAERSAAAFFGNGALPSGILQTDNALSETAYNRLKEERDAIHGGVENWHRLAILEEGIKWHQLSTDPEKAQLIETRKFQTTEVARILNLPPHILKDLERSTFTNIEHQGQELVTYSFRPWAVRFEQVYEKRLLLPRERKTHVIRYNLGGFLRGDMAAQSAFFASARQWGYYSANDVLEDLDRNPIGPEGDVYLVPINMIPADQARIALAPDNDDEGEGRMERRAEADGRAAQLRKRTEASFLLVFRQRLDGLFRREANAIRRALTKAASGGGVQEFLIWLQRFYEENAGYIADDMRAAFTSLATAIYRLGADEVGLLDSDRDVDPWVAGWAERFGRDESASSLGQLEDLLRENPLFEDAQAAVEQRVGEWEAGRGAKVASREVVTMGSKAAVLAFIDAGIRRKTWWTNPDACPLCRKMHGRTVSISAPFLSAGEEVDPGDGETTPLRVERNYATPQLHGGCDCTVVAAF